jgi:hypothetical protein
MRFIFWNSGFFELIADARRAKRRGRELARTTSTIDRRSEQAFEKGGYHRLARNKNVLSRELVFRVSLSAESVVLAALSRAPRAG